MIDRARLTEIVSDATLAPSPHNLQGWRFLWNGERLRLQIDPQRRLPLLDPTDRETYIGLGAGLENLRLAARHRGYFPEVGYFPEGEGALTVADITFTPTPEQSDEDFAWLAKRATNRRPFRAWRPDPRTVRRLESVLDDNPEFRLHLLTAPAQVSAAARLIGDAELTRYEHPGIHQEIYQWFRFTGRQARRQRDGLAFETAEVTRLPIQWAASLLLKPALRRPLSRFGINRILAGSAYRLARSAPVIGLLISRRDDNLGYLQGGQALQRVWHAATALELGFQIMNAPTEMVQALKTGHADSFASAPRERLPSLRHRLYDLFPIGDATGLIVMFRLGPADPPSARSLRRPVDDVLVFAG